MAFVLVVDDSGVPLQGLSPSWLYYEVLPAGAAPGPTWVESSILGVYEAPVSDADKEAGVVGLVDFGPTASPQYVAVTKYEPHKLLWAVVVTDANTGALWTGSSPLFSPGSFFGSSGPRTPPAVEAKAAGLYLVQPTEADIADKAYGILTAPVGASETYWMLSSTNVRPAPRKTLDVNAASSRGGQKMHIKRGDLLPLLEGWLVQPDPTKFDPRRVKAYDLTGCTVTFRMRNALSAPGAYLFSRPATVVDPLAGYVKYTWQPGDTVVAGHYVGEWVVINAGKQQTMPTISSVAIEINDTT